MSEILVGEYLFRRVKELGVETVFGVPGDYELALLDLPIKEGLEWVGTPNELVGAYAADGYARYKGFGALVTTFGPGELSALCCIGGAFCEFVPVLHIVGYPTSAAQASGNILHHTLGDGSYDHYIKMSRELSCATAVLKDSATATGEIDRVLRAMLYHSQPGYIGISEDIAHAKVPSSGLNTKLARNLPENDPEAEARVISDIIKKIEDAKNPIVMVDGGAGRYDWTGHTDELVSALGIPFFVTTLGKGGVSEDSPLYGGAYSGLGSHPNVAKAVESADCILWLGNIPSDFNTGMFTEHVKSSTIIDFQRFSITIGEAKHVTKMNHVLPKLIDAIRSHPSLSTRGAGMKVPLRDAAKPSPVAEITHDWLWPRLRSFVKPGDLIVTETGTSQAGFLVTDLPGKTAAWTQAVYGSIGYAAGAAVGASIAAKETGKYKRLVLITGEGSLQLTVQSFSILNRHGIPSVTLVLNNAGYTVERYFHGFDQKYNNVPAWDYCALFKAFSPTVPEARAFKTTTAAELDSLLADKEFQTATYPQCVDIVMDYADAPSLLKGMFAAKQKGGS